MKTTRLIILLGLAVPGILFAQGKDAGKPDAATEKELMKMEEECSAALTKGDATVLGGMLAESFYAVTPDGNTQTKAQFVTELKAGDLKIESNKLSEMKVQLADADMAVVTYQSTDKGTYKGKDISGQYRWTDVMVKRDGKWQFAVSQGTQIEQKPAQ